MTAHTSALRALAGQLRRGELSRRQFIERAAAAGIGAGLATFLANAATAGAGPNGFAFYQGADGTPVASPVAGAGGIPAVGMQGRTRGEGGELRILQWQAPTHLNSHRSTGGKDFMAADIVCEPLLRYAEDGTLIANLVTAAPSVENGLLAEDLSSVTFNLVPGVLWSDGEPFTSRDVQFTFEWITTESNASINVASWSVIESIDTPDELTAVVTFKSPSAAWFEPFTGGYIGHIYPAHAFGDDPANANEDFLLAPIGTGPYVVESISPNDQATFVINENYRFPDKPYFERVLLKGGGDAASAARAVLQTGDYDFAPMLQIEPEVLAEMQEGGNGVVVVVPGAGAEQIYINFSDPNTEVDGQRSEMNTPHPFLTDPAVREALNLAVDRALIADEFYGEGQPPTANVFTGLPSFESPNTSWAFDLDQAAQVLEDAGWAMDGDTRAKDGVRLELTYATTVNQVRQKNQAVIKDAFEQLGIGVRLEQVDAGIFFDNAPGNELNIGHMYVDINMYTNGATTPVPIAYTGNWYSGGESRDNIAQKSNTWLGTNRQRWISDEYDALFEQLKAATDVETAFDLIIQMNDVIINDRAIIPIVNRSSDTYAASSTLEPANIAIGVGFELNYWNLANWNRTA
jgi:peptide/nickel transport system substrate-binding protein